MDRLPRTAAIWTATGAALAAALVVATGLANAGGEAPGDAGGPPTEIALPNGFQPEGIAIDPETGETARTGVVDVAGDGLLPNGDGLLVVGQTLFVVQNRLNALAVLEINGTGSQADLVDRLSDERFDVPTTVAAFEDLLYLPNARFGIEATPETEYNAVAIARP